MLTSKSAFTGRGSLRHAPAHDGSLTDPRDMGSESRVLRPGGADYACTGTTSRLTVEAQVEK